MIIDIIGCLHGFYPSLEGGDLLIITGDLTRRDTQEEVSQFDDWLSAQKYTKKIFIAGNHDNRLIEEKPRKYLLEVANYKREKFEYLCDSGTEFGGLKIWGSPWTKTFPGINPRCCAFTVDTDEELAAKWALIPDDIDILITHGPPWGIKDKSYTKEHCGSKSLALKIGIMEDPPKLWVWSHIHEDYGIDLSIRSKPCKMVNASHVNEYYQPVNKPIRIIL